MRVAGTEFNLAHRALEVYLSGCKAPHCKNCHNRELWDFNQGIPYQEWFHEQRHNGLFKEGKEGMVERVWVLGGEPLDQNRISFQIFLTQMKEYFSEIWLWTRYENVPKELKHLVSYAKLGRYDNTKQPYTEPLFNIKLASENQRIIEI